MQADRTDEIDLTAPLSEQGSAWWILLNEGHATESDRRAFAEWVTRSPERVGAYLRAAQVARAASVGVGLQVAPKAVNLFGSRETVQRDGRGRTIHAPQRARGLHGSRT